MRRLSTFSNSRCEAGNVAFTKVAAGNQFGSATEGLGSSELLDGCNGGDGFSGSRPASLSARCNTISI